MKVLGGQKRCFFIKSLELKCHAHIFYYLCYYTPTHGRIFIHYTRWSKGRQNDALSLKPRGRAEAEDSTAEKPGFVGLNLTDWLLGM